MTAEVLKKLWVGPDPKTVPPSTTSSSMRVEFHPEPFRHWLLRDFLPPEECLALHADLPDQDWAGWEARYDNDVERAKRTVRPGMNQPESWEKVFRQLLGPAFLGFLTETTGITSLAADPVHHGAGIHVTDAGGFLQIHLDYSKHPTLDLERRLSLILFANPGWKKEWGGSLLLADAWGKRVRSYSPAFNTAVVFENGEDSYHGVQHVDEGAPPRLTVASYYLAAPRPTSRRRRAMFFPNRSGGVPNEVR